MDRFLFLEMLALLCLPLALPMVPSALGDSVQLSAPMPLAQAGDVTDFRLTSDGTRAVYRADQENDEVFELYSVPVDGSAPALRLNQAPPEGADVRSFEIAAGDRVVYTAELEGLSGIAGLFSVPADGSAPPILLHGPAITDFQLGAGQSFAV